MLPRLPMLMPAEAYALWASSYPARAHNPVMQAEERAMLALMPDLLKSFKSVLVPELNMGQLCHLVRGKFLIDAKPITKVQGLPFTSAELESAIQDALNEGAGK